VKPPASASKQENRPQQLGSEHDHFFWLFKMEHAWRETENPLTKISEYYENIQKSPGPFPAPFIEAAYLLARFRCGDASALETLRTNAGPTPDAYSANGVLATYYESIGETGEALRYLENRFQHAPDSGRKLHSARALATFLAGIGKSEDGLLLLRSQLPYFQSAHDQAMLWEAMGNIYESRNFHWQKHLSFEKALKLNPDNTDLRFSLAYSYGESGYGNAMAAYHYRILLTQRPGYSMATNNLSVIYDEIGATGEKVSLLREAVRRKDNSYVAANLATAYARAGFIEDARGYLQDIPAGEQQEAIVRAAYRNVVDQVKADKQVSEKLEQLIKIEKDLVYDDGLSQLDQSSHELLLRFVGEWAVPNRMTLSITEDNGKLNCELTAQTEYYEHASYNITIRYEPGILEVDAALDEKSLKERRTPTRSGSPAGEAMFGGLGGIGGALPTNTLLGIAFSRPSEACLFVLVPCEGESLIGLHANSSRAGLQKREQTLLGAKQVKLTKRAPTDV
jgi:tetratricopeptide (TPR) repeat protein